MALRLVVLSTALVLALLTPARALDANDRWLFRATNHARIVRGLAPLDRRARLQRVAKREVRRIIACRCLSHTVKPPCRYWGQNIGVGLTARRVFRGFMHSAEHRHNILDPRMHRAGMVVQRAYGFAWVAQEFCGRRR